MKYIALEKVEHQLVEQLKVLLKQKTYELDKADSIQECYQYTNAQWSIVASTTRILEALREDAIEVPDNTIPDRINSILDALATEADIKEAADGEGN